MATDLPPHADQRLPTGLPSIDCGADQECVSLEYDYYDLVQKPTKTPLSFDVTEEEEEDDGEVETGVERPTVRSLHPSSEHFVVDAGTEGERFSLDAAGTEGFIVVPEDTSDDDEDDDDLDILNLEDSVVGSSAASEALEELLNADSCVVETEFLRGRKGRPAVRVKFQDLSKPYVPRVRIGEGNYTKFLHIVRGAEEASTLDMSPDSGINDLQHLTPEDQERQKQEWAEELAKMEEEINTLKQVLNKRTRDAAELKKKLGFSVWKEFNDDISQGIKNVKETQVYQSAENLVKPVAEKATNILGGFGYGISTKLGQIKSSESFRSFEEKVGSAYENVKHVLLGHASDSSAATATPSDGFQTKVSTSRSSSVQSFDDALAAGTRTNIVSPPSTPVIPEEKEIK